MDVEAFSLFPNVHTKYIRWTCHNPLWYPSGLDICKPLCEPLSPGTTYEVRIDGTWPQAAEHFGRDKFRHTLWSRHLRVLQRKWALWPGDYIKKGGSPGNRTNIIQVEYALMNAAKSYPPPHEHYSGCSLRTVQTYLRLDSEPAAPIKQRTLLPPSPPKNKHEQSCPTQQERAPTIYLGHLDPDLKTLERTPEEIWPRTVPQGVEQNLLVLAPLVSKK